MKKRFKRLVPESPRVPQVSLPRLDVPGDSQSGRRASCGLPPLACHPFQLNCVLRATRRAEDPSEAPIRVFSLQRRRQSDSEGQERRRGQFELARWRGCTSERRRCSHRCEAAAVLCVGQQWPRESSASSTCCRNVWPGAERCDGLSRSSHSRRSAGRLLALPCLLLSDHWISKHTARPARRARTPTVNPSSPLAMSEPGPSSARRERRQGACNNLETKVRLNTACSAASSPRTVRRVPPPPPPPLKDRVPVKPAPKLPAELIQSIVDYVCEDLQPLAMRRACRDLSLVSRDWRDPAQRRIFREVDIASRDALARMANIVSQPHPSVGRFVRELSLHFTSENLRREDLARLYDGCTQLSSLHLTATYEGMRTLVSTLSSTPAGRAVGVIRLRLAEVATPATDPSFFAELSSLASLQQWEIITAEAVTLAGKRIDDRLCLTQLYIVFLPDGVADCSKRLIRHGTPQTDFSKLEAGDLCFARLGKRMIQAVRAACSMSTLRIFDCKREDLDDICDILDACSSLEHLDIEGETLSSDETQILFEAMPRSLITLTLDLGMTFKSSVRYQYVQAFTRLRRDAPLSRVRLVFDKYFEMWPKKVVENDVVWKVRLRLTLSEFTCSLSPSAAHALRRVSQRRRRLTPLLACLSGVSRHSPRISASTRCTLDPRTLDKPPPLRPSRLWAGASTATSACNFRMSRLSS